MYTVELIVRLESPHLELNRRPKLSRFISSTPAFPMDIRLLADRSEPSRNRNVERSNFLPFKASGALGRSGTLAINRVVAGSKAERELAPRTGYATAIHSRYANVMSKFAVTVSTSCCVSSHRLKMTRFFHLLLISTLFNLFSDAYLLHMRN